MLKSRPSFADALTHAQDEAVTICQDLIRCDTSNFGDNSGPGEIECAHYVMDKLREVGLEPTLYLADAHRANVVVRIPGSNPKASALCIHGHLDVVPADAKDWQHDPLCGDIIDGCVYGRGAVDMKGMDAMMLALVRALARSGTAPTRDLVVAFFADEEAGGVYGAKWMVDHHPEVFAGVTEAISEVGGFSVTVEHRDTGKATRAYLVQTAEKGLMWLNLRATGTAGHGSVVNTDNAVVHLARAIDRLSQHTFERDIISSVRDLLDGLSFLTGIPYTDDDCTELLNAVPSARPFVEATLADNVNVTMVQSGYKHNVVPQEATAAIDVRPLPGHADDIRALLQELVGEKVEITDHHLARSLETAFSGRFVEDMIAAIKAEDPEAAVLPYCLSGGTDNKWLAELGITGYGFAPLQLTPDLHFAPLFHGIDERVPADALRFGTRVLARLVLSD